MLRVHKIVALLIAAISFSKEDAFAHRRDYDGFRAMHVRRACRPSHPWDGRRAVMVPMRPGAIFGPGALYARRACRPVLMRMGVIPGRPMMMRRSVVPARSMMMRRSVVPASHFLRTAHGNPLVMRRAYPRGFWHRGW